MTPLTGGHSYSIVPELAKGGIQVQKGNPGALLSVAGEQPITISPKESNETSS